MTALPPRAVAPKPSPTDGKRSLTAVASLLRPSTWLHALRMLHYYAYTHANERPKLTLGAGARLAPNVSLSNAEYIVVGPRTNIGAHCTLWAGIAGSIEIGADSLLAPGVMLTATGYEYRAGSPVGQQRKIGKPIKIGNDVWLGANVVVVGGVEIGDGVVIGANSVVTRSIQAGVIAVGSPAREVDRRFPSNGLSE